MSESAATCCARGQTEWGPRCVRKATRTWQGVALCSQHFKIALRGDLDPHRDVVRASDPLPEDLERILRDPSIVIDRDGSVAALIADSLRRDVSIETVPRGAYLMLFALYEKAVRDAD